MGQQNVHPINSREWWEEYFVKNWDAHGGGHQTRYFMQRLLAELPPPEMAFLRSKPLTILDWGCAFGEGVELLSQSFSQSRVVGIDFSSKAIEQARQRHPDCEFVLAENGEITAEFDIIVTSNCLEHFEHPLEVIDSHLRSCRKLYIALVPFNEYPLSECHRSQFREESFPQRIGNFVRLCLRAIDTEPAYWKGQQLLVVYGSQSYLRERAEIEATASEQEKWDKYYSSLPLYEPDEPTQAFGVELSERISELIPAGSKILEAGSGGGWQSLALAKTGRFQISLMDFSREALQYAKRLFEREGLSADFIYGDVFTQGEPQFDLVFNAGVLEHYSLEEQTALLRGMASLSRNYVLALVPNRLCYWYWLWRIQKSASGEWPFGKEVPLSDFSGPFRTAGLKFLGQTFMGQQWAEFFIAEVGKADRRLYDSILEISRSRVIPKEQKSYLLAGLGSVSPETTEAPSVWLPAHLRGDVRDDELNAALADALALRISAQQELARLQAQVLDKDHAIEKLSSESSERERSIQALIAESAEKDQGLQTLSSKLREGEKDLQTLVSKLEEKERELQILSSELRQKDQALSELSTQMVEKDQAIRTLSSEVKARQETISTLSSQLSEAEQTALSLSSQMMMKERSSEALSERLSAKEYELQRITDSLGWRLLSRYGRIKYRYLLPIYRALRLPPYNKRAAGNVTEIEMPKKETMQPLPSSSSGGNQAAAAQVAMKKLPYVAYESNAYDIVCFPIIDWDFRFQRPQQLMSRFAAAGHRVFYITQAFHSSGPSYTIREKRENVYEISFRGPERNVYTDVLDDKACDALFDSLDALRRDLLLGATVSFVQLPFWSPLAGRARTQFAWPVVYDCMDYHAGFSTSKKPLVEHERDLLSSADLVVVSSGFLEEQARPYSSNVLVVRNACEYDHFAKAGEAHNKRPVIGYYGAIADWFDSDLVSDLAEKRPDWDFVLVGSTFSGDTRRLSKLPNVSLPGEKHYSEIPDWLGRFDVTIIPFKRTPLTEATNPVKAYEILASGKPLVSVPIPEMVSLAPMVRFASTAEEFESEITAALNEDAPTLVEKRRAFAREHTWEKRYDVITPAVRSLFPKASIIIITFNNLALNRLCLESLYARTEWPNFEVIVLDNASTDGTPAYLKEAEKVFPNLRVILNEENLGFARGNNVGIKQASGDYIVLLNNDTVLTRGWLSALIKHLHADPKIGLIGPVTNEIGNEAKVSVGYILLEDLPVWAADYIRENDNQLFDIPMVAMFCVAMRREVIERVGLLDEGFEIGMFEDDDYTRRVEENGYKIVCARDSFVHHAGRASFKLLGDNKYLELFQKNRAVYERKWGLWQPHWDKKDRERVPDLCGYMRKIIKKSGIDPNRVVVFLPSIGWNNSLVQRPHHLAAELARQGFLVFFDCSGSLVDRFAGFVRVEKNLWIYNGPMGVLDLLERPILWTFPYNASLTKRWEDSVIVYDWIDDLSVFPYNQTWLEGNHARMLDEADLILCVARNLHGAAQENRPDALYVPNGVEFERFSSPAKRTAVDFRFSEMVDEGRPVVGYYGAIANWFDVDLLAEAAQARPDWSYVIIGHRLPDAPSLKALEEKSNVLVLSAQKYEHLPAYLARFTATMIPFKVNKITEATSPLKLYEYFAAGKPVISTPMPECQSFEEVLIVRDAQEFSRALDVALSRSNDAGFQKRLHALGRENSWTARVQVVGAELSKIVKADNRRNQQPDSELTSPASNEDVEVALSQITGEENEVAARFRHLRTDQNRHYFDALTRHFSPIASDPCLPMYFEYAITCNERGRAVASLLQKYVDLRGKHYLDIGCAYGGFLVAFAEHEAEVTGIDIDQTLLHLAECNLIDNGLDIRLFVRDATRSADLKRFHDSFDVITCNDVIEHVEDPQALLHTISEMLRDDGIVYFEIPNRNFPSFVMQDGHYQLFGITLLDYRDAEQYYSLQVPGTAYTVRHYLEIEQYARMFANAGLEMTVLPEILEGVSIENIISNVAELRAHAETGLSKVPAPVRERVSQKLAEYLREVESAPRNTDLQRREFKLRYGISFWRILGHKNTLQPGDAPRTRRSTTSEQTPPGVIPTASGGKSLAPPELVQAQNARHGGLLAEMSYHLGRCCICGKDTAFYYKEKSMYRESLLCGECLTTSRYRSISRGILQAIRELTGIEADSLANLPTAAENISLDIYDTQVPFYYVLASYSIPDLLAKCKWINMHTSIYRPGKPLGMKKGKSTTNQNLEKLTFPDSSFDIVITSDVMEHVRLDYRAHQEIRRVLKPGGIYLFTVPHFRERRETLTRVAVVDSSDPSKDLFLMEKEYHGDANSGDGRALSYRAYGTDLDETLNALGFSVDYCKEDFPEMGIMNTELFYCRLSK